jgi:hypothetical protein
MALLLTAASLPLWHDALVSLGAAYDAHQIVVATQQSADRAAELAKMESLLRYQAAHPNPRGDYTLPSKGDFSPPSGRLRLD